MRPNEKKLKDLILYILSNYNNSSLTETKLQKLLYFCDFAHYQKCNESITGYSYYKNRFGPTIKTLPSVMLDLEKDGYIKIIREKNYYGQPQTNFAILKLVETPFEDSEKLIVDKVNSSYSNLTPRDISKLSHQDPPYVVAEDQEKIDYDSVIYRDDTDEEGEKDKDAQKYFDDAKLDDLFPAK